jgi:hypothetical protein
MRNHLSLRPVYKVLLVYLGFLESTEKGLILKNAVLAGENRSLEEGCLAKSRPAQVRNLRGNHNILAALLPELFKLIDKYLCSSSKLFRGRGTF